MEALRTQGKEEELGKIFILFAFFSSILLVESNGGGCASTCSRITMVAALAFLLSHF